MFRECHPSLSVNVEAFRVATYEQFERRVREDDVLRPFLEEVAGLAPKLAFAQ